MQILTYTGESGETPDKPGTIPRAGNNPDIVIGTYTRALNEIQNLTDVINYVIIRLDILYPSPDIVYKIQSNITFLILI